MFTKNKIIKIFPNPYFLFLIFLLYLILGTGIHGDEYTEITKRINDSFFDFFKKGFFDISILYLPSYFLFWWSFTIIAFKNVFFYDLIKVIIIFISFVLIFKFISTYIDRWRAFIFSVFFILFPTHDTTTYWLMTNPYILMPALIMFSHYKLDIYIQDSLYSKESNFRILTESDCTDCIWDIKINGRKVKPKTENYSFLKTEYYFGERDRWADFIIPPFILMNGTNTVSISLENKELIKLVYYDVIFEY